MDEGHVIPEDIRGLLERRTTFQEWLSRLGELGSEFRPEVADKVRGDYQSRLREVEAELEGHRSELESALGGRRAAVEEAAARHDARAAEMEECELRYRVGEYGDEEWEHLRGEHQSVLDELDSELTTQRSAVGALEAVLGELVGSAGAATEPTDATGGEALEAHDTVLVEPAVDVPGEPGEYGLPAEIDEPEPWMSAPFDADVADSEAEPGEAEEPEPDGHATGLSVADDVPAGLLETGEVAALTTGDRDPEEKAEEPSEEAAATSGEAESDAEEAEAPGEEPDSPGDEGESPVEQLPEGETAEFMDELEFLESLSLDDAESFDAVSAMLEDEEGGGDETDERKTEDS
jgi:hypothetical protein